MFKQKENDKIKLDKTHIAGLVVVTAITLFALVFALYTKGNLGSQRVIDNIVKEDIMALKEFDGVKDAFAEDGKIVVITEAKEKVVLSKEDVNDAVQRGNPKNAVKEMLDQAVVQENNSSKEKGSNKEESTKVAQNDKNDTSKVVDKKDNVTSSKDQSSKTPVKPQENKPSAPTQKPSNPTKPSEKPAEKPAAPKDVVTQKRKIRKEAIPFEKRTEETSSLYKGETQIKQNGQNGQREIAHLETYTNGKLTSSVEEYNKVTVEPVAQITLVGTKNPEPVGVSGYVDYEASRALFNELNASRRAAGKYELVWSDALYEAASIRAKEITHTFSHTRPNGTSHTSLGIMGENITKGHRSAAAAQQGFMNSPGHREVLMNEYYPAGAAVLYRSDKGGTYWVQAFGN